MSKENNIPSIFQILVRLVIFASIVGLGIWQLAGSVGKPGEVEGESTVGVGELLPRPIKEVAQQTVEVIPKDTRRAIEEAVKGRVLGKSEEIPKNQVTKEIENIIEKTTVQITGFPGKQKEEVKKQVVRQVCSELLQEVNK